MDPQRRRALAGSRSVNVEPWPGTLSSSIDAAEHLREPPADRQAQAGAAVSASRRAVQLPEVLEDLRCDRPSGMPTPVSLTAIDIMPRSAHRRSPPIVTEPCGVNFSALLSRFSTICFTFCRSLLSGGSSRRHLRSDGQLRALDDRLELGHHLVTRSGTRNVDRLSGIRPASIRVMSRMSLMSASRCRELESIRVRLLRCGSDTAPVTPLSSMCV